MSVIDYLKKGGKTSASDIIAGLAGVLGIQPEEMAQLWEVGVQKYGSEEALGEALDSAVDGIQDPSSDEFKQAVASVFTEEQTMFAKQGGKLNQLVDRFAKGGKAIDCGCGGKKLKCGGKAKKGGVVKAANGMTTKEMYKEFMDLYGNHKSEIEQIPTSAERISASLTNPDLWISAKTAKEGAAQQGTLTRRAFRQNERNRLRDELGLRGAELVRNLNQRTKENADTFYGNKIRATIDAVKSLDNLTGIAARQEARKLIAGVYDNPVVPVVEQLPVEIKSSESLSKDYEKSFGDRIKTRTEATIAGYKPLEATPVNPLADKSNEELAREVIRGIYGNGAVRREALGDRYNAVQAIVNKGFERIPQAIREETPVVSMVSDERRERPVININPNRQYIVRTETAPTLLEKVWNIKSPLRKDGGMIEKDGEGKNILGNWIANISNRYLGKSAPDTEESKSRRLYYWKDRNGEHVKEDANVNGTFVKTFVDVPQPGDTLITQKILTNHGYKNVVIDPNSFPGRTVLRRTRYGFLK